MKIAALILSVLGALASMALAAKWLGDASEARELINALSAMGEDIAEIERLVTAAYVLLGAGVLALAAGILTFKGKGNIGAIMLCAAIVAPAVLAMQTLLGTFLLVPAALLAFLSHRKLMASSAAAPRPTMA